MGFRLALCLPHHEDVGTPSFWSQVTRDLEDTLPALTARLCDVACVAALSVACCSHILCLLHALPL